MKAIHSTEYFEKYKDDLFKRYRKECDYEHDLAILLPDFSELPAEAREKAEAVVTKMTAQKVVDVAKERLVKKMHSIKAIKDGKASLGYTTRNQEISAWHDLNEGFEFSCYMLAEFEHKYGLA